MTRTTGREGSAIPTVAILGATGLVGRRTLALLDSRAFPCETVRLLASERSGARVLPFRGRDVPVEPVSEAGFAGVGLALFATPADLSRRWAGVARAAGALVVDYSSAFRLEPDVPLVVPEVNGALLEARPWLVANPNCVAAPLALVLHALRALGALRRVVVASYQSVSGAGSEALAELDSGVRAGLDGAPPPRGDGGPAYAFNVVPQIDRFDDAGWTGEELKIIRETRKLLALPELAVTATAVRVPVRVGHCAAVWVSFDRATTPDAAREALRAAPGIRVVDEPGAGRFPTPLEAEGGDDVLVGRVRADAGDGDGLALFFASDNLRKGAALNAVQIAERLARMPAATR